MRSLKFHLVRAQDILCFGPNGVEVHFNDHGQIIQVVGINLDMPGTDELPASNAAGKSSLQELLSIGLFGRTVKNPTKNKGTQIINTLAVKGEIEVQWDDYRLLRTFKKKKDGGVEAKLQLWKSLNKIWDKQSEVDRLKHNLDEEIQRAIGLSHHAFCNVVIFDDSSEYSFLEADTPTKRQIVENLLDLDQYRGYYDNAKKFLKDNKEKIVALTRDYTHSLEDVAAIERRATMILAQEKSWLAGKEQEITNLKSRIDQKQKALQLTDNGSQLDMWQAAQNQMLSLRDDNIDLEAKRKRIDEVISSVREKVESIRVERATIKELISERNASLQACKTDLARAEKLIDKLKNLEDGASCPYCLGTIHKANHDFVISQSRDEIEKFQRTMAEDVAFIASEQEKYDKKTVSIAAMEDKIREADGKLLSLGSKIRKNNTEINDLSLLPKPEGNTVEQVLEAEVVELRKQLKSKQEEIMVSPYKEVIEQIEVEKLEKEKERDQKGNELKEAEEETPYFQFWAEAFGDNGIRKFVIDGIIPALNDRVAYWMEILCEGLIEITFDNTLKETMTRNGNRADYSSTSNGERRRINLAVSQAFAHVMMLNSGTCPNLVFLDEITGGGIDRAGIPGVHNMIYELAKERQVFVTTHNETLSHLLQGCETITLKKQNDITVLAS